MFSTHIFQSLLIQIECEKPFADSLRTKQNIPFPWKKKLSFIWPFYGQSCIKTVRGPLHLNKDGPL